MRTGWMVLEEDNFTLLKGMNLALLVNQTSVDACLNPTYRRLMHHNGIKLKRLFSPEHGLWSVAQDQELVKKEFDPSQIEVVSLYRDSLEPDYEQLKNIDALVFDIQDVGVRYYTYVSSMILSMKACVQSNTHFIVLDRPNPLGGDMEGPMLKPSYCSYVGMFPMPVRHGLTVGEIAQYIHETWHIQCELTVVHCQNWQRHIWFDETALPWIPPSPNMPTLNTAIVYPGGCLLEATNISEGRGTTTPFEIFGAPWIDPFKVVHELRQAKLPGVIFRPHFFKPLANKYAGKVCGGVALQVTNRKNFQSFLTTVTFLSIVHRLYPEYFQWKTPPYEFETEKMPIDILTGSEQIRSLIDSGDDLAYLPALWKEERFRFAQEVEPYLQYSPPPQP